MAVQLDQIYSTFKFRRAAHLGSPSLDSQLQLLEFLSAPQTGQIPLQSSRQRLRDGNESNNCSFTNSSTSIASPSKTDTARSSSESSTMFEALYSESVIYSNPKSLLMTDSNGFKQRSHSISTCVSK